MPARDEANTAELLRDVHLVQTALREAGRAAILAHKRAGLPLVIWRDGKTVLVPPEELDDLLEAGPEPGSP